MFVKAEVFASGVDRWVSKNILHCVIVTTKGTFQKVAYFAILVDKT